MPADPIDLRQRQGVGEGHLEHRPQAHLEGLGVHRLGHLVLADRQARVDHLAEIGLVEGLAADVGEHHPVAPRQDQLTLIPARLDHEQGVAGEQIHDRHGIGPGLLEGIGLLLEPVIGQQADRGPVDPLDLVPLPVLDLQHQQAAAGVQQDEVRMPLAWTERDVVPAQVVVLELVDQALGEAALAGGGAAGEAGEGGDEGGHWGR